MNSEHQTIKILLVEDYLAEARLLQEYLKESSLQHFTLIHVQRLREALQEIKRDRFDIILLDLTLPDSQSLDSLQPLLQIAPNLPIVVLTNINDDELAIAAVRQGAQDYLVKRQVTPQGLSRSIRYAIERKQAMENLRKNNKALSLKVQERTQELVAAKEQNQLKSELVSMFSHDLRNPLNTILVAAGLLQDGKIQLSFDKKERLFRQIRSASKSMQQLLDEVLLIGKADAHQLECNCVRLDLKAFLQQLLTDFQEQIATTHHLQFSFEGIWFLACWDEILLKHILMNLLTNAVKYSPEGGTIEFKAVSNWKQVTWTLSDPGIGIPLEDQNSLFQPFHRGKNVGKIKGTGLGLALVQRCVETHYGTISVRSVEGQGTTFTIIFPLLDPKIGNCDRLPTNSRELHSHPY